MTMRPRQRQAVLLNLAYELRNKGSWCGSTHMQKAVYFLDYLTKDAEGIPPLNLPFMLYKHGPFSFELRNQITAMRASLLIKLDHQRSPYSPKLKVSDSGHRLIGRWPKTTTKYRAYIKFVVEQLAPYGIEQLEQLVTALYTTRKFPNASVDERAKELNRIKPFIDFELAQIAVIEVDKILAKLPPELRTTPAS